MSIADLEKFRDRYSEHKKLDSSSISALFILDDFLNILFSYDDKAIVEAYFSEYLKEYVSHVSSFDPSGQQPAKVESILNNCKKIKREQVVTSEEFIIGVELLKERYEKIKNKLNGREVKNKSNGLTFPVLVKDEQNNFIYGFIESIIIAIEKHSQLTDDQFIIVPSFGKLDKKLEIQIRTSWQAAKQLIFRNKKKKFPNHKIIIQFNKKYGIYEGDSLGIALTIGFAQTLAGHYNLRELINIKENIVYTGSVNEGGEISGMSEEIISKKTELVFYSEADVFIIPEQDKLFAEKKVEELKIEYPKRKLEIVSVSSFNDLLNRRNLVELKKQHILTRAAKKTAKNKISLTLIITLLFLSGYFLMKDIDNNPVNMVFANRSAVAKNKFGKSLWEINPAISQSGEMDIQRFYKNYFTIDFKTKSGLNEIYVCGIKNYNGIIKFNYNGEEAWRYLHKEFVSTDRESYTDNYAVHRIFGLVETNNGKQLVAAAQHSPYFINVVLKLDPETGKPAAESFYHPGGVSGADIDDVDNDGQLEFLGAGISNGYKCASFFSLEYNKLTGTAPAPKGYQIQNKEIADFDFYILLPMTDFGIYNYPKYNWVMERPAYQKERGTLSVLTVESGLPTRKNIEMLQYDFSLDLSSVKIVVNDAFAVSRDKLINEGKLNRPYSDTPEYREIVKRNIKIWNGENFVQMFTTNKNDIQN